MAVKLRGRPAHTPGPTFIAYTPNGKKLITVGLNNAIRVFSTGSDAEPVNIDDCSDANTAVAATNDFFLTGSEDGAVSKFSLVTSSLEGIITRCTLPIRDIAISPDGQWAAVASDELAVKVIRIHEIERVLYLREQSKPVKHVSFDHSGSMIAVSCSDGAVYFYSLSTEQPRLVKKFSALVRSLETDAEASSKVIWHPDGRAFAAPTVSGEVRVVSTSDWQYQRTFKSGHVRDITALGWSSNGALLATSGTDKRIQLWETRTQKVIKTYDDVRATVLAVQWHPTENILSYSNNDGELYIHTDFVPSEHLPLLAKDLQPAPLIHDPLSGASGNARRPLANDLKNGLTGRKARRGTPDSLDEILGEDGYAEDNFVEDDDGNGYAEEVVTNGNGKRTNGHLPISYPSAKRPAWSPQIHEPFQSGSTPWRGNRRYLCLNLTGFVWTVDQDTHHTVTVEFYDREAHRDFHFTDPFKYDKACLNERGTLFSSPARQDQPALIFYRPHETWTTRSDWRTPLPAGESVVAVSLGDSYVVVVTDMGYVRVYTLFGTPVRVYRTKSNPAVTCASWRDYVITVGNGSVGADGMCRLVYSIENVRRDEVCQSEDVVAMPEGTSLISVFWSDAGDPCIYDTTGTLLTLVHWRTSGQAQWVPLLCTQSLARLASGRKEESYWPVAVAQSRFHCIILKGGEQYPYFPRPLLSEFDFQIPVSSTSAKAGKGKRENEDDEDEGTSAEDGVDGRAKLEESFVRTALLAALLSDQLSSTHATSSQRSELSRREIEVDKALLQLLALECREGEERGMKALEVAGLMRDRTGRMLDAAGKIAARFGRDVLGEKLRELAERRMVGLVGDDE